MRIKRTNKAPLILTVEDHRRATQFVALLFAVGRRVDATRKSKGKTIKKDKRVRENIREPCFFDRNFYHEVIDFIFYKVITMIDTIVLTLASHQYQIVEPDKFRPSAKWIFDPSLIPAGICSKQNVTAGQLRHGIYKPYLTLSNCKTRDDKRDIMLKIELSLPKLIFGNNFQELQYKDFSRVLKRLGAELISMGVIVDENVLARAPVQAIHYSKNIELKDGSTPYHYLQRIKEANVPMAIDTNETNYRNDGHCYKWHCNSYEVVFYDKIKELEQAKRGKKRTAEKDGTLQLKLLEKLANRHNYEVLRMEVRLKRSKMKTLFAKLGVKADLTFKALFKPAISKKVLLHYLDELESKRPPLLDFKAKNDAAILVALCYNNPDLGPKQMLQLFGLKKALETMTARELQVLFERFSKRSWSRIMAEAQKVSLPRAANPLGNLRKHLSKFKCCKL